MYFYSKSGTEVGLLASILSTDRRGTEIYNKEGNYKWTDKKTEPIFFKNPVAQNILISAIWRGSPIQQQ